ncbi:MAG: glutamate ligase domain-containing protein, partial [Gammaproteobacteria bacterium]
RGLRTDATAVLNRDDAFYDGWAASSSASLQVSFGLHAEADYRAENIRQQDAEGVLAIEFDLVYPDGRVALRLPMAGIHNVMNALAATAAGMAAGASADAVVAGLSEIRNVAGRLRVCRSDCGAVVYDDSYNANPASVTAAINFLSALDGERWLVLGDMGELGSDAAAQHSAIGTLARKEGIERLLTVGPLSRNAAESFGDDAASFDSAAELTAVLHKELGPNTKVLVKASRYMALDKVVAALVDGATIQEGAG